MCSTSKEPLKTSKIVRIQQSPWRPATLYNALIAFCNIIYKAAYIAYTAAFANLAII
jgi:hypothetical protein